MKSSKLKKFPVRSPFKLEGPAQNVVVILVQESMSKFRGDYTCSLVAWVDTKRSRAERVTVHGSFTFDPTWVKTFEEYRNRPSELKAIIQKYWPLAHQPPKLRIESVQYGGYWWSRGLQNELVPILEPFVEDKYQKKLSWQKMVGSRLGDLK